MSKRPKQFRSLAEQIADLDDLAPRDFDPEDLLDHGQHDDEESDSGSEIDQADAREHYQPVSKSKLRKADEINLGKPYEGHSISRDTLDAGDSDDDPFGKSASEHGESDNENMSSAEEQYDNPDDVDLNGAQGVDDEDIDSDGAFGESDDDLQRRFKFLGSGRTRVGNNDEAEDAEIEDEEDSGLDDEEEEGDDDDSVDVDMEDKALSDMSAEGDFKSGSEQSEDESLSSANAAEPRNDRATLRQLMASDQKSVAATISQAAKADAVKGRAVKRQRSTFDILLNTRIKLQKGLAASNSLPSQEQDAQDGVGAIEAAEKAAQSLWTTINDLRQDLAKSQNLEVGQQREGPSARSPSDVLWDHMHAIEAGFLPQRRSVLNKWSSKVRAATVPDNRGKLLPQSQQQGLTALLDIQLVTESERLIQRTMVSRSANQESELGQNGQHPKSSAENALIFDDTDFYQVLLRELVQQRMDSSSNMVSLPIMTSLRATRVKKAVDTKASKGRKMRYTVHEKLQNFMAPDDRGSWTEKARDEFFGSLLGARADRALVEEDNEEESGGEAEALKLFRA